jgi:hypothetical protein
MVLLGNHPRDLVLSERVSHCRVGSPMTDEQQKIVTEVADWLEAHGESMSVDMEFVLRKIADKLRDGSWREKVPARTYSP